jgi:wobble nucleotide-excising tRNase
MLDRFQLLRNVGQFDNVNTGAHLPCTALTLAYAENGRGKTTLAAILRSVSNADPVLVASRRRLGAPHEPHIVLVTSNGQFVFQNGQWSGSVPEIAVFDDAFVAANVCSGIEIDPAHRQNLHELILGAQGVALNAGLQQCVARIEEHNRALRELELRIPAASRGGVSVDAFCALPNLPDIDRLIEAAERALAAAQFSDEIRRQNPFQPFELPEFDVAAINAVLAARLPELEAAAAAQVQEHIRELGDDGEAWVDEGMRKLRSEAGHDRESCPFCVQDLSGSPIIRHYQAYFSEAYERLRASIMQLGRQIGATHGGDTPAAFERWFRLSVQSREFWSKFTEIPEVDLDTAAIIRTWNAAREAVLAKIEAKKSAPLEPLPLSDADVAAIRVYDADRERVRTISAALVDTNAAIALVKEQAEAANLAAAQSDVARLRLTKARHSPPLAEACEAYLAEKAAKAATEQDRGRARDALDNYRRNIFPAYEAAINDYLRRFNAGFRLGAVDTVNIRGGSGSSCTYQVVINNVAVALTADEGPSFRTTLSAGDRNTLALAFFFAALDQDPDIANKIVIIDDPMTSLDEHRSLTTVQEMRRLLARVRQIIVMSHSKPFLCQLWEGADPVERSAITLLRDGEGSTLAAWDVSRDCITEHDRRHELVREYLRAANPATERQVAESLRFIVEAFLRVSYPGWFPPGTLLGPFINICDQRVGTPNEILARADLNELQALVPYLNRFHHDTNPAYATAAINDQELRHYAERVIAFARRA